MNDEWDVPLDAGDADEQNDGTNEDSDDDDNDARHRWKQVTTKQCTAWRPRPAQATFAIYIGGVTSHWRFYWRSDVVFGLPKIYKKLSYRKQIARKLRIQYVDGIYSNSVTMKSWLRVT